MQAEDLPPSVSSHVETLREGFACATRDGHTPEGITRALRRCECRLRYSRWETRKTENGEQKSLDFAGDLAQEWWRTNSARLLRKTMKRLNHFLMGWMRGIQDVLIAFAFVGFVIQSDAQGYSLNSRNSSVQFEVGSPSAGMFDWVVDGVNHLNQAWYYYRAGAMTSEAPIQSIGVPTISYINNTALSRLELVYANADYSVRTMYLLTGQTPGTGNANVSETVTVINNSAAPLDFHLFQYSDFDLGGISDNQSVQFFLNDATGQYYKAVQTVSGFSVTETVNSTAPPISHVEAATFSQTLASLTDALPTSLGDTLSAMGNVTFAYQWDVVLTPGQSFQLSKLIAVVPEPSVGGFIALGVLAFGLMRRRARA
jgi:hypothetical protein